MITLLGWLLEGKVYDVMTMWERRFEKEVVRKKLWERRCEKKIVERRLKKVLRKRKKKNLRLTPAFLNRQIFVKKKVYCIGWDCASLMPMFIIWMKTRPLRYLCAVRLRLGWNVRFSPNPLCHRFLYARIIGLRQKTRRLKL